MKTHAGEHQNPCTAYIPYIPYTGAKHGVDRTITAQSSPTSSHGSSAPHQPDGHGNGMIRTIAPLNDTDDHPILQMPSRSPAMVEGSGSQQMVRHFIDADPHENEISTRMMAGRSSDGMRGADGDVDAGYPLRCWASPSNPTNLPFCQ